MEKIVITTMNQKSMGKSTIAMALAGHFYFNRNQRVLVIDADEEQLTSFREYQRSQANGEYNTFDVIDWSIRNGKRFRERVGDVWGDYDIFIIDTPGSLIDFSSKGEIAKMSDLILVPISPKRYDVDSFKIFTNKIKPELGKNTDLKFIRNYHAPHLINWKEHEQEYEGNYGGFTYLDSGIPDKQDYSRFLWLLEANNDQHWTNFYNEIERLLTDKKLWQKNQHHN